MDCNSQGGILGNGFPNLGQFAIQQRIKETVINFGKVLEQFQPRL
jgi:hypothetical protein